MNKQICDNCEWWKKIINGTLYGGVGDRKSKEATKKVALWFRTNSDFGCIFWKEK